MSAFEPRWKALSDLLTELRARGAEIPAHVVEDLRSARSLIEVLKVSSGREDVAGMVEQLLLGVEAYLLAEAELRLGPAEAEKWAKRISEATFQSEVEALEERLRFRPGLPRGEHWVRVRVSDEIPRELVERLAADEGVSARMQPDGFVLVSGPKEKVMGFVRKLTEHVKKGRS